MKIRLLRDAEVFEELDAVEAGYRRRLSDEAAATIASWWMSPGSVGRELSKLAHGMPVRRGALLDDIAATLRDVGSAQGAYQLDVLSAWAKTRLK